MRREGLAGTCSPVSAVCRCEAGYQLLGTHLRPPEPPQPRPWGLPLPPQPGGCPAHGAAYRLSHPWQGDLAVTN